MTTEKSINKISTITIMFISLLVFTVISICIVKKMDNTTSEGLLYAVANIPNLIAESIVESVNNELIKKDIIISQQLLKNLSFAFKTYWMSSTLSSYCIATYFIGCGLFQTPLKLVCCPLISPFLMPVIIIIAIILLIKNSVYLLQR